MCCSGKAHERIQIGAQACSREAGCSPERGVARLAGAGSERASGKRWPSWQLGGIRASDCCSGGNPSQKARRFLQPLALSTSRACGAPWPSGLCSRSQMESVIPSHPFTSITCPAQALRHLSGRGRISALYHVSSEEVCFNHRT